jgi:5-histidylcysteine sulfoxide synthase/putative 4-mercaptohistidine N1-methyltranferase
MRTPHLAGKDGEKKREEIRRYFHETSELYESLFEVLQDEKAYYVKPIPLRHPLIFYYGHTATFFVNKLILAKLIDSRIDPRLESMFAVGVDEMSWDDLNDAHYEWPRVEEVKRYRQKVRALVDDLMERLPVDLPIDWESSWWPILMGIEHERIHLETSSVLIRQHDLKHVRSHPAWQPCRQTGNAPENGLVEIPGGCVLLGKHDATYGWDNEYGRHEAQIVSFQAGRHLVSNGEYLAFVDAGGYEKDEFWSDEGLAWRNYAKANHPTFWKKEEQGWKLRLMTEEIPMPWDWPVEVNCLEAMAFCSWKRVVSKLPYRLPTEDEWYRLHELSSPSEANLHLDHYASSCPVNVFRQGDLFDVTGNVWQWTGTPIYPFEGFKVHPLYDDFTTPTFDGKHNLMKGGSWISTGNEALASARYAFRRHFFQHAGFRYVVSDFQPEIHSSRYETDRLLSEYAEFHYGENHFNVPNFPRALCELAVSAMEGKPMRRALDLGCAVGRASFELAKHFDHVVGVDFSARFIGLGVQLAEQGLLRYALAEEGELMSWKAVSLRELGLDQARKKVEFWQGDACNLKPHFRNFDLILAANLIDRLYSPKKFLSAVHERINPGGILLIASPYTWLEEHTPREEWLGGFKKDGENFTTLDALKALLGKHFRMVGEPVDVPFVIRETARKHQHTISQATIWERLS